MPCYQQRTMSIDLGKLDPVLLGEAMDDLGYNKYFYTYDAAAGRISLEGSAADLSIDEIKRAYSAQVVKQTAKRFGWKITQTKANQFKVVKR